MEFLNTPITFGHLIMFFLIYMLLTVIEAAWGIFKKLLRRMSDAKTDN